MSSGMIATVRGGAVGAGGRAGLVPAGEGEGLQECPVCRYSLEGLPAAYRCPECGFAYDVTTRAWKPTSLISYAGMSFIALGVVAAGWAVAAVFSVLTPEREFALALMAALWSWLLARDAWKFFGGPFVAITRDGLLVRRQRGNIHTFAWREVAGAEMVRLGLRSFVRVRLRHRHRGLDLTSMVGRDVRAQSELVELVREYTKENESRSAR